jgi:hypothetical protein
VSRAAVSRAELVVAAAAFAAMAFAVGAMGGFRPRPNGAASAVGAVALFVVLVGGYLACGVGAVVHALRRVVRESRVRALVGPGALWVTVVLYAALAGLPLLPRIAAFGAYLIAPALLVAWRATPSTRAPVRELAAIALLWLPIEFRLLPPLPLPAPNGTNVARFAGLVDAMLLFLVVRPLPDVGYTFALRGRDAAVAVLAFLVYSLVALPLGFATRFITWHPALHGAPTALVLRPLLIYLLTAVPEEFLFRGLIQNLLTRWWGPARALPVASVVFGLAHLPDPRYVVLATLAGLAYGWVYQRTARIAASAVTHALVDAVWVILLRA